MSYQTYLRLTFFCETQKYGSLFPSRNKILKLTFSQTAMTHFNGRQCQVSIVNLLTK